MTAADHWWSKTFLLSPYLLSIRCQYICIILKACNNVCRAFWAFSREGAIPLRQVWSAVNSCTGTPVNAVWAMTAAAFLMGLPILASPDALGCNATAIACVCLDASCKIALLLPSMPSYHPHCPLVTLNALLLPMPS